MKEVSVAGIELNNQNEFALICGLNVLESDEVLTKVVEETLAITKKLSIPFIFKASYDKANRSSKDSYRGPGIKEGLRTLKSIKED